MLNLKTWPFLSFDKFTLYSKLFKIRRVRQKKPWLIYLNEWGRGFFVNSPQGQFLCKPVPSFGSREQCQHSQSCPCGEYCDRQLGICRPAVCTSGSVCQTYPEFSHRFQCRNNICMPSHDVYLQAFVRLFDRESISGSILCLADVFL